MEVVMGDNSFTDGVSEGIGFMLINIPEWSRVMESNFACITVLI